MRILFATGRRYPPDRHGGAQSSAHALLRRLVERGHHCEVVAARGPGIGLHLSRIAHLASGRRWTGPADDHNGYPTRRAAPWQVSRLVAARIDAARPDVVVTDQVELLDALDDRVPRVVRIADVAFRARDAALLRRPRLYAFANSRFIANALREFAGIDAPVLYPIVEAGTCRAPQRHPETITFINPIEGKGLETALRIAALLPHRPFVFVSGWPRPGAEEAGLRDRIRPLANVRLLPWAPDLRAVYGRTRVLLFPARWEEGFGRVVLEAHVNAIPVIASDRGGLPEAVGDGGIVLPVDAPAEQWAGAVERLMTDDACFAALATAAAANLSRPEFDPGHTADRFVAFLERAAR